VFELVLERQPDGVHRLEDRGVLVDRRVRVAGPWGIEGGADHGRVRHRCLPGRGDRGLDAAADLGVDSVQGGGTDTALDEAGPRDRDRIAVRPPLR